MQVWQGTHDLSYRASCPPHPPSRRNFGGVPFEKLMWGSFLIGDKAEVTNQTLESQICWGLPTSQVKLPPRPSKFMLKLAPSLRPILHHHLARSRSLICREHRHPAKHFFVGFRLANKNDHSNPMLFVRQGTRRDAPRFLRHLPVNKVTDFGT